MSKKAEKVVSIRLPAGLADELRAVTNVPVSTLARNLLVTFLNSHKKKQESKNVKSD